MERKQVQDVIHATFAGLPVPQPQTIFGPVDPQERSNVETLRQELADKNWQSLSAECLTKWWAWFGYFTPDAYRFYVTAFLRAALNEFPDNDFMYTAVSALRPSLNSVYYEGEDSSLHAKQSAFTESQYRAVCDFLGLAFDQEAGRSRHHAAQTLHYGWNRFDTPALQAANQYYHELRTFTYPEPEDTQIAALCREIRAAFATTPYPGDDELSDPGKGEEPAEMALDLRGVQWQSASPDLLARCYSALSFLSDAGFRYFLPAYLIADICGYEGNAEPVLDLTRGLYDENIDRENMKDLQAFVDAGMIPLDSLQEAGLSGEKVQELLAWVAEQSKKFDSRAGSLRRLQAFNHAERTAIIHYLEFRAKDEYEAVKINQALEGYWRPSLQATVI